MLTSRYILCILKSGILNCLISKVRAHPFYEDIEYLITSLLSNGHGISIEFAHKWGPILTEKLFDYYLRTAANDFFITMMEAILGLNNASERLTFRIQVLTGTVKMLNG